MSNFTREDLDRAERLIVQAQAKLRKARDEISLLRIYLTMQESKAKQKQ